MGSMKTKLAASPCCIQEGLVSDSRRLPIPFDQVLSPLSAPTTDAVTSNRALVPIFDLAQNRFQIVGDKFPTFAGILNLNSRRSHRVGEISVARLSAGVEVFLGKDFPRRILLGPAGRVATFGFSAVPVA
jgi:hypothetical protein